jgi:imidazole glycerol-phosphate synthase subunit HisH
MIGIIDYGMGNVGSISNMLRKLGHKSKICLNAKDLESCSKVILPGVGSFDNAMQSLNTKGFIEIIINKIEKGDLFLGICLGMQLLGTASEEGDLNGLDIIPGQIIKFPDSDKFKVPHMGWNSVSFNKNSTFNNVEDNRYYFVHSYYFSPNDDAYILGKTSYIIDFVSCVRKDNVFGFQFHPEKSHKYGMTLLDSFVKIY